MPWVWIVLMAVAVGIGAYCGIKAAIWRSR
jgi:hypothetical protein